MGNICCGPKDNQGAPAKKKELTGPMSNQVDDQNKLINRGPRKTYRNASSTRLSMQVAEDIGLADLEKTSQLSEIAEDDDVNYESSSAEDEEAPQGEIIASKPIEQLVVASIPDQQEEDPETKQEFVLEDFMHGGVDYYMDEANHGDKKIEKSQVMNFCIGNSNSLNDDPSVSQKFIEEHVPSASGIYQKYNNVGSEEIDNHDHIQNDINAFNKWMKDDIKDFQMMHSSSVILNTKAVKSSIMNQFKKSMAQAVEKECLYYHFYHSGHSNSDGSILVSDEESTMEDSRNENRNRLISLKEILATVQQSGFKFVFKITVDHSFSGNWCFQARELFRTENYDFNVVVQSSCTRENPSYIGSYTKVLNGEQNQVKYAKVQGIAKFYADNTGNYIVELLDSHRKKGLQELIKSAFHADGLVCNDFELIKQSIINKKAKVCFVYYQLSFTEVEAYEIVRDLCEKHGVPFVSTLTGREQGALVSKQNCVQYHDDLIGKKQVGCKMFTVTDFGSDQTGLSNQAWEQIQHFSSYDRSLTPESNRYDKRQDTTFKAQKVYQIQE